MKRFMTCASFNLPGLLPKHMCPPGEALIRIYVESIKDGLLEINVITPDNGKDYDFLHNNSLWEENNDVKEYWDRKKGER